MMTPGIRAMLVGDESGFSVFTRCLDRHFAGDCGEMCEEDVLANERALRDGERIFSSYDTEFGKLWIITEADRSATTVLFPSEY